MVHLSQRLSKNCFYYHFTSSTFSSWLHKNISKAKSKQAAMTPVKEQIDKKIEEMKGEMGVTGIRQEMKVINC